ncbi:MAG TPA: tail fiber domain-containing protein [Thermoanaerobaculia bacterium]
MQARSISRYVLLSLSCLLLLPTLSFAKSSSPEPVGHLTASGSSVQWMTSAVDHEKVVLTVVGPNGAVFQKEFARGSAPSFRLQDLGGRLTDGSYTYELRMVPRISDEVKKQLAAARAEGDDDAAGRIQTAAGINANALVQSGSLLVVNGAFVSPDLEEQVSGPTAAGKTPAASSVKVIKPLDIVQADDVIIQGSLCVGLDCVVNESFGFDTIRLKENNTRIKFNDTSTGTGFPNHNWQLTANDSASGGANKFSIEDITAATVPFTVTGSAPSNSIFVDSTGRLGLRTATPVLDIHVATGNTPALRFEQNSSGGFTAQTWDVAGNEANFFVRDVTGGSRLPFRIRPGAPTSSIDIAASGKVGVGTASPASNLHVFGTSATDVFIGVGEDPTGATGTESALTIGYGGASLGQASGFFNVRPDSNAVAPNPSLRFLTANVQRMIIDNEGFVGLGVANPAFPIEHSSGAHLTAGGIWADASSRGFKQDIENLDSNEAMQALKGLQPVRYAYKVDPTEHHIGFIAEDVPDLVATKDRKSLSPMDIVGVLTKVVQQQQSTIDELKARIDQLEAKKQ